MRVVLAKPSPTPPSPPQRIFQKPGNGEAHAIPVYVQIPTRHCTRYFRWRNYKHLKEEFVTVGGVQQEHKYFSSEHDIALGLSLDGFCPFKRQNQTCWPLIIFNYNLPPNLRFLLQHILCVGVIYLSTEAEG
jgi:hypothetical protein